MLLKLATPTVTSRHPCQTTDRGPPSRCYRGALIDRILRWFPRTKCLPNRTVGRKKVFLAVIDFVNCIKRRIVSLSKRNTFPSHSPVNGQWALWMGLWLDYKAPRRARGSTDPDFVLWLCGDCPVIAGHVEFRGSVFSTVSYYGFLSSSFCW